MIRVKPDGSLQDELWSNTELGSLHGGVVFYRALYGSDSKGNWVSQNPFTGEVIFKGKLLDGKGSITCADGILYCYSEKGTLGLIEPTTDGLKLVSSFKITMGEGSHWAHPVILNGRLYIRHGDVLMAFDIAGK